MASRVTGRGPPGDSVPRPGCAVCVIRHGGCGCENSWRWPQSMITPTGNMSFGGSYIHSFRAANDVYARGWFDQPCFATSLLGEDHIMSLLAVAAGYRIADFGRPEDPMALKWRGLPAHPEGCSPIRSW